MKALLLAAALAWGAPLIAQAHQYVIPSPVHGQTYAYGSINRQQWIIRGPDQHLALSTEFTNDPFVDRFNPRQYDYFIFDFPGVRLGADGRTFYYRTKSGHEVPVARKRSGFLGIGDIQLLDTASLFIDKPHGYLSLALIVTDGHPASTASL